MRILHAIFSTEFAGSEAYCCQLAALQAAAGDEVLVLIRDGSPAYAARVRRDAAPARVAHVSRAWPSLFEGLGALGSIRAFAPDIVHTHLGRATQRLGPVARLLGVPLVATLHIDWRRPYATCDAVICIAGWQRAGVPASYRGRVAVIWNWVRPARTRRAFPSPPPGAGPRFLSVGRLVPNKGMDVLVRAFRQAFPGGDERVSLAIAGSGPQLAELQALAAGETRIAVLGYVEDAAPLYAEADVYVSAARFEPFGLTILEAMQAGCRLVCTRTQGPSEYLAGRPLLWAEVDDVASLAHALRTAAALPVQRVAWDLSSFDPTDACRRIRDVYAEILAR